jgi:hypothetical protein
VRPWLHNIREKLVAVAGVGKWTEKEKAGIASGTAAKNNSPALNGCCFRKIAAVKGAVKSGTSKQPRKRY